MTSAGNSVPVICRCLLTVCIVLATLTSQGEAIVHDTSLIWVQTPLVKVYSNSRLVAIRGDPEKWVKATKPTVTHIRAPHFTWDFKALDFHWEDQLLFWSESTHKKIQSVNLNGSLETSTIFQGTSSEVYGLAVDWLSRNIYYTDALYNWITMKSMFASRKGYRLVIQTGLDSPHGLAVHPLHGHLYWSDWGVRPKIERSSLLGESREVLLDRDLGKPQGITLDYQNDLLYWVDATKATIEVCDLNGDGRKVLFTAEGNTFFDIALYKELIFASEQSQGVLRTYNHRENVVNYNIRATPWGIAMYDNSTQPGMNNVCEEKGCEQMCIYDQVQGATCVCGEGYELSEMDNTTCEPHERFVHPSHFFAIENSICSYPANMPDMSLQNVTLGKQCFLGDKHLQPGYLTLEFDAKENMLYYFSNYSKTISRLPLEMGAKASVVSGGTGIIQGMSLDWVSENLYWTDVTHKAIYVSKKSGLYQHVLIDGLHVPVGIAVHPGRGEVYWSDHGSSDVAASVEKARLDGSGRDIVMADDVSQPNQLFIDFITDSLYWADSMQYHIRKVDLNTGRITVVYEASGVLFYGVSVYNDFLIWTDRDDVDRDTNSVHVGRNGIHMAMLKTGEKVRGILNKPRDGIAADLVTFDPRNQPDLSNPCAANITKCAQLCLAQDNVTGSCYCGLGYTLDTDGISCVSEPEADNFVLVSDVFQKSIFQVDVATEDVKALDITDIEMAVAIDHDPPFMLYWSDTEANEIRRATVEGKHASVVRYMNSSTVCDGIAVDYINRILFYTDTGNNLIGAVSLNNNEYYAHIITENLDEPRALVVSPNEGLIYWSDWGKGGGIERANMDGSNRTKLFSPGIGSGWINGLALDIDAKILYWVDASDKTINSMNVETLETKVLLTHQAHYFAIDVLDDYIYVTDWLVNYIQRMPKTGGNLTAFGPTSFSKLYGMKAYSSTKRIKGYNLCAYSHCDHLCLPNKQETDGYTCRCAEGYISDDGGVTCYKPTESTVAAMTTAVQLGTTNADNATATTLRTTSPTSSSSKITPAFTSPSTPPTATTRRTTTTTAATKQLTDLLPPTYVVSHVPITMVMTATVPAANTASDASGVDFVISTAAPSRKTSRLPVSETSKEGGHNILSATLIAVIVFCGVVIIVSVIALFLWYRRYYKYRVSHGKLKEELQRSDSIQVAFNERRGTVTFDNGGGIENPSYDYINGTD